MSLSKQAFLLLSILFFAIFAVNYQASVTNIRDYLQTEAQIHAQDTATSLGLSLQPYIQAPEDTMIPTLVNAIFDRGYYGKIVLEDFDGKEILSRENPRTFQNIPDWFTKLLPLKPAAGTTEINDGWNIAAILTVQVHPGYGYLKLWEQARKALLYSMITFVLAIGMLFFVLQLIMRPLKRIEKQAIQVGDGHYEPISPLPWTSDIRRVASAMNLMTGKIERVISSLQEKMNKTVSQLNTDQLTGLDNQSLFQAALKDMFISGSSGFIFILRIDELGEFAAKHSTSKVDEFIRSFANTTVEEVAEKGQVFRLGGSEFGITARDMSKNDAAELCTRLTKRYNKLGESAGKANVAHIGATAFDHLGTSDSILSGAMESYTKARLIGNNSFVVEESSSGSRSAEDWVHLVNRVIKEKLFTLSLIEPARILSGENRGDLILEEAVTQVFDEENQPLSIGTFVSVAEEIQQITTFDTMILSAVLEYITSKEIPHNIAVNLSFSSLRNNDFRSHLFGLLDKYKQIAPQLVFSVTAYSAAKDLTSLSSFTELVHRLGAQIMLKRFEPQFISLDQLKEYKFDYIRLARVFTEDISKDPQKKRLLESMVELGNLFEVTIIAESVPEGEDMEIVAGSGIHAASARA